jgi:small conductance mechanosensitive channel
LIRSCARRPVREQIWLSDNYGLGLSEAASQISFQFPTDLLIRVVIFDLVLVAAYGVSRILGILIMKSVGRINQNAARTAKRTVSLLVWIIGFLTALDQLGLETNILLLMVALSGFVVVISLRDILPNVVSRETIALYETFKVGDWIESGSNFGRVVDINSVNTTLMTLDNETLHIPNSELTSRPLVNRTTPGGIRIRVSVTVEPNRSLQKTEDALLEIGEELGDELVKDYKPETRITKINGGLSEVSLLLRLVNPARSELISSEVRRRYMKRMTESEG